MKKPLVSCQSAFLALLCAAGAAALPAQKTDTVPPGFDTTATTDLLDFSIWFGAFPQARYQIAASSPNQSPKTISQIEFRQEDRLFSPSAKPRSWTTVTLQMAETIASALSATWTTNILTTPTVVYSGCTHFTDLSRPASSSPARWGMGGLRFPFSKPFVYTAKNDLLSDYVFLGGSLTNQATWSSSPGSPYMLDGVSSRIASGGVTTLLGNPLFCRDSAQVLAGFANVFVLSYAKKTGNTKLDDRFAFLFHHERLPPNSNVIDGLGLRGVTNEALGVNVGACRFLMIAPALLMGFKTNSKGGGDTPVQLIPYDAQLVGTQLWMQSAYSDSKTAAFDLSMASLTVVEAQPPVRPWKAPWVYRPDPKPPSGNLRTLHAPLQRVTFK